MAGVNLSRKREILDLEKSLGFPLFYDSLEISSNAKLSKLEIKGYLDSKGVYQAFSAKSSLENIVEKFDYDSFFKGSEYVSNPECLKNIKRRTLLYTGLLFLTVLFSVFFYLDVRVALVFVIALILFKPVLRSSRFWNISTKLIYSFLGEYNCSDKKAFFFSLYDLDTYFLSEKLNKKRSKDEEISHVNLIHKSILHESFLREEM